MDNETIVRLAPSTEYDVRLRAVNQRPQMPNYSDYLSVQVKTKGEKKYDRLQDSHSIHFWNLVVPVSGVKLYEL